MDGKNLLKGSNKPRKSKAIRVVPVLPDGFGDMAEIYNKEEDREVEQKPIGIITYDKRSVIDDQKIDVILKINFRVHLRNADALKRSLEEWSAQWD